MSTIQNWQIEDAKVKALDDLRVGLNTTCARAMYQIDTDSAYYLSSQTIFKIDKQLRFLGKKLKDINKLKNKHLNPFDILILQDVEKNFNDLFIYHDFFNNPKTKLKFESFFSRLIGRKDAYKEYLQMLSPKNYPHEELDRQSELYHELTMRQVFPELILNNTTKNEKFKELANKLESQLKQDAEFSIEFYKSIGLNGLENISSDFSPYPFSFSDDINELVALNPDKLLCYRDKDGNYKFSNIDSKITLVHEFGHNLHSLLSKNLPEGLHGNSEQFLIYHHGISLEGVALATEDFAVEYMENNRENFNFSDEDLDKARLQKIGYLAKKVPMIVFNLLEKREYQEELSAYIPPQFKKHARVALEEISNTRRVKTDHIIFDDIPFDEIMSRVRYIEGDKRIQPIVEKMKDKGYGANVILPALFHGCWSDVKAQEKFIFDLYLPNL